MTLLLANDLSDQTVIFGQAADIPLASGIFSGVGASTTYTAALSNGQPLPSWLSFDTATGHMSVAGTAAVGIYDVLITAHDGAAASAPAVQTLRVAGPVQLLEAAPDRAFGDKAAFSFSIPADSFSIVGQPAAQQHFEVLGAIDSLTEGFAGSSYADFMTQHMRGLYDDGGPGYLSFSSSSSVISASGRVEYLGGPVANPGLEKYSINGRGINVSGADGRDNFVWDPKRGWDQATIYYLQQPDGGTMTVHGAGGGGLVTINTAGPLALRSITVDSDRGQSDSSLSIESMTGHLTVFGADFTLNQDGASFSNVAIGGTSLTNWSHLDSSFRREWFAALHPDVYVLNAGMNDRGLLSGAQYKAMVAAILDDFAAASPTTKIILEGSNDVGSSGQDYLASFRTALQQLAQERGLTYIDDTATLGNYASAAAAGYMFDAIHPNATGNTLRANTILTADGIDPTSAVGAVDGFLNASADGITFSATMADGSPLPAWLQFDSVTGQFSGANGQKPVGSYSIVVTATGPDGHTATDQFVLRLASDLTLTGTASSEVLDGDLGADTLSGLGGADTLHGLAGNDILVGGAGADLLDGGAGTDVASYAASASAVSVSLDTGLGSGGDAEGDHLVAVESLWGSAFDDVLIGDSLNNELVGNGGNDLLSGGLGRDLLRGNDGNDQLDGGGGADTMLGGAGDDTYVVDNTGDQVTENAGEGADSVLASVSFTLLANVENLTLTGSSAINGTGNALDNRITGNSAANVLFGADGADLLIGGGDNDTIDGGNGVDVVQFGGARAQYDISQLSDGSLKVSDLRSGAPDGIDTVKNVETYRFADRDYSFNELTSAPPQPDTTPPTLAASMSRSQIISGQTATVTFQFSETVSGFDASDVTAVNGQLSAFTAVDGDTFTAVFTPTPNFSGQGSVSVAAGSYVDNVGLAGSAAQSTVVINTVGQGQTLNGTSGNDSLRGTGTNDTLNGLAGNDTLNSGAGADTMNGGPGDDVYYVGVGDTTIEKPNEGVDWVNTSISFTLAPNIENMTLLGAAAINGTGNELANIINGNDAINVLTGFDGDDQLRGNGGDDTLLGGAGNDYLSGGAGNDIVIGGAGSDTLYGGAGADQFVFQSLADFGPSPALDQIGGFSSAEGDKIDLSAIDANSILAGAQAFTFIGTAAFSNQAGQLRYQSVGGGNLRVEGDVNGDHIADFQFYVGAASLSASDFILQSDTTPPTVAISSNDGQLTVGETATLTFQFSETVVGFTAASISATQGQLSGFTAVDGDTYTAVFTPTANFNGQGGVAVTAGAYADAAGNAGAAGQAALAINTIPPDVTPPTVTVSVDDNQLLVGETATVTFQFSETVTGFGAADVSAQNGQLSGFTAVDGDTYTAVFTPTGNFNGQGSVAVASGSYADTAGNLGGAGQTTFVVNTVPSDTSPPTVVINVNDPQLTVGETATLTFNFSEPVSGFTVGDLNVTNGQLSAFTALDASTYSAVFTPAANFAGQGIILLPTGSFTDLAGNAGVAGQTVIDIATTPPDTTPPTVVLSVDDTQLTVGETATLTFQFSEAVTGFTSTNLVVSNGHLSAFTAIDADTYTATFTPDPDFAGQGGVAVKAGDYTDIAGNAGAAGQTTFGINTIQADVTPPTLTVSVSDAQLTAGETALVTFQFSELVTGFAAGDVTVQNGQLSAFTAVDGDTFTAVFTPTANFSGQGVIGVAAGSYADAAANAGAAGQASLTINTVPADTTPPTLTVSVNDAQLTAGETALVTFQFSELVTGFAAGDVTAQNGQLSAFTAVDGDTFTAVFTPTANFNGQGLIGVAAGSYADAAANAGAAGQTSLTINTVPADTTPPTLTVTVDDAQLTAGETALVTFQFSELVTGFAAGDVTAQNGQLSAFTAVDGDTFTAVFTPTANFNGQAVIGVAAGSYADVAGNAGAAGQTSLSVNTTGHVITGTSGADNIRGVGGSDTLFGLAGNDILNSGAGADTMYGGPGDDVYYVGVGDTTIEKPNEGVDWVNTSISFTLAPNIENMTLLGAAAVNGTGNELANIINGNDAINVLTGFDGDDQLRGNGGDDTLLGGAGNDYLSGGAGNDIVIGGAGSDTLYGGAGADQFVFQSLADFGPSPALDQIGGFSSAEGDKIDLSAIDANVAIGGDQAFTFIGTAAFSNQAGQLRYQSVGGGNLRVEGDLNGDHIADFQFYVGSSALAASDFIL